MAHSLSFLFDNKTHIDLGIITLSKKDITDYAKQYDPQPFHIDEEFSRDYFLGRLCASGYQTCSVFFKHFFQQFLSRYSIIGCKNIPDIIWKKPFFVDTSIHATASIIQKEPLDENIVIYTFLCRAIECDTDDLVMQMTCLIAVNSHENSL